MLSRYGLAVTGPSGLAVPLRSNAHALVAGAPINRVRKRLKFASLCYDKIFLEAGQARINAGPNGASSWLFPGVEAESPPRWDTARRRGSSKRGGFSIAIGEEAISGEPALSMRPFIQSQTTISWNPTFEPFRTEFSRDCDWIEFATFPKPDTDVMAVVRKWTEADKANPALLRSLPVKFARDIVISHANADLGLITSAGLSASVDRLHMEVISQRFQPDSNWAVTGFALPVLFPNVEMMPWAEIARVRRNKHFLRFREILREVEREALTEAATGDVEAAAHHAYQRHLADVVPTLDGWKGQAQTLMRDWIIGGAIGYATSGFTGPLGLAVGSLIGTLPGAVGGIRGQILSRKRRGWVVVHSYLAGIR